MWWAWGKELAILVEPRQIRWRHFDRRYRPNDYKESISQVSVEEAEAVDMARFEPAGVPEWKGLRARAYVSEDVCNIGWVRAPAQRLTRQEVNALVQQNQPKTQLGGTHSLIEIDVLRHGYLYASIASHILATVRRLADTAGAKLSSARPVLAPVVSNWLRMPSTRAASRRSLVVLGARASFAFTAERGELVDAARYATLALNDDFAARLSALRISLGWRAGEHDVIAGPHIAASRDRKSSTEATRNFSDLYAIAAAE